MLFHDGLTTGELLSKKGPGGAYLIRKKKIRQSHDRRINGEKVHNYDDYDEEEEVKEETEY